MAPPLGNAKGVDFKGGYAVRYDAKKKPVDFVFQQITQGWAVDDYSKEFKDSNPRITRKAVEILHEDIQPVPVRGAYHYDRVEIEWKRQADNFLEWYFRLGGYHCAAWDYEKLKNPPLTWQTDRNALDAITYIERAIYPQRVYLYCNLYELADMLNRGAQWVLGKHNWIARWFRNDYFDRPDVTHPLSQIKLPRIVKWDIWQYGGDYRDPTGWQVHGYKQGREYGVQQDSIDLNYYNGSLGKMILDHGVLDAPMPTEPEPLTLESLDKRVRKLEAG